MDASEIIERFPDANPNEREILATLIKHLTIKVEDHQRFDRTKVKVMLQLDGYTISEDYVELPAN